MTREEAIKIVKSATVYTPKETEALETLIPELAESEDERMRRRLIEYFTAQSDDYHFLSFTKSDLLAWLEKQKEQKPAEKQDYSGLNDLERAIHRGFLAAGVANVPVTIIKETAKECLAQMKPAEWSEDFDKEVESVHKRYPEVSFAKLTRIAYHFAKWADKYKSTEWSGEDERKRLACIDTINEVIDYERDRWEDYNPRKPYRPITKYDEQIDWLKSKLNGNPGK